MKKPKMLRSGFTLIELLVVVIIIVILSGMLFKISGMVSQKAARAKAIADIENIQNALNEYYSEYGMFPPTSDNRYVFENSTNQTGALRTYLADHNDPGAGADNFVADRGGRPTPYNSSIGDISYEYGLVSYLWGRGMGDQPHWYDEDTERDAEAKRRWAHYLENVNLWGGYISLTFRLQESEQPYSNSVVSVKDPWEHDYNYSSVSPHQTYELWSGGPTGSSADDIRRGEYNE
jgi:prepilin-type N-terminal cleavage/methylation domain-containing protein